MLRYISCHLLKRKKLTQDTELFSFGASSQPLPTGAGGSQHLRVRLNSAGKTITRQYTPISRVSPKHETTTDQLDLLIKMYPGGEMSHFWKKMEIGEEVEVAVEPDTFIYKKGEYKHMILIAGGTGIAPILNIIRTILDTGDDPIRLTLLFANRTMEDILLKEELLELVNLYQNFNVVFIVSNVPSNVPKVICSRAIFFESTYVSISILSQPLISSIITQSCQIVCCGSPTMERHVSDCLIQLYGPQIVSHIFLFSFQPPRMEDARGTNGQPEPPEPSTCCGQQCANCVWLQYIQQLKEHMKEENPNASKEKLKEMLKDMPIDSTTKAYLNLEIQLME